MFMVKILLDIASILKYIFYLLIDYSDPLLPGRRAGNKETSVAMFA